MADTTAYNKITAIDPQGLFSELIKTASVYLNEKDLEQIRHAYDFATNAHIEQFRKTGEPYIIHPIEAARILADIKLDADTISATLLHDTVEDTKATFDDIKDQFGEDVAILVDGVTNINKLQIETLTEAQSNNFRKMLIAMSKDIRVIVIKLADRLHNMRTLKALSEDRRIFKAKETMEIYAPLANRLGINSIKWELEDLSFYYLEPAKYLSVQRMVAESRDAREKYMDDIIQQLQEELNRLDISAIISGRPKHLYSIYQKMELKGKGFSEIYDLIGLRIIVEDITACYASLGAVHSLWQPMPGRFKDYIATPKFNMYQSLHTTVMGSAGRPLEIQIRTKEMHQISEYGVAAHWRYKDGGGGYGTTDDQLSWLRRMLDWQDYTDDPKEFMSSLKNDLAEREVFVFTPQGELQRLRFGATPLDFAYAIHTEVGHRCVGAKINGIIVPLSYELQMGDRVEILTQKNSSPGRDWLNIVVTPSARTKIRSYLSKISKGDDIMHGRDVLGREARKHGLGISSSKSTAAIKQIAADMHYNSVDDLFAAVGKGSISGKHVANSLLKALQVNAKDKPVDNMDKLEEIAGMPIPKRQVEHSPRGRKKNDVGVFVKGVDNVLIKLAKCCNPVPGDEILGFVSRGRGVVVHRCDCVNVCDLYKDSPERFIVVEWEKNPHAVFQVEVYVGAIDRTRLLQDVAVKLSDLGAFILNSSTNSQHDGLVEMHFVFQTSSSQQIDKMLAELRGVDGVFEARRSMQGER